MIRAGSTPNSTTQPQLFDIEVVLSKLKNNEASGPGGIAKMLKEMKEEIMQILGKF